MKKISISLIAIAMSVPAMADPVTPNIAVGTNPADCNETVLETTSGTANLEANWTANTLHLSWSVDGSPYATNDSNAATCTYDSGITIPTNPSKTGYTFAGWTVKQLASILASLDESINGNVSYGHGWWNNADEYSRCTSETCDYETTPYSGATDIALNEWNTEFSYGTVYGEASCQASLDSDMAYLVNNIDAVMEGEMSAETFLTNYAQLAGAEKAGILQDIYGRMLSGAISDDEGWSETMEKLLSSDNNTRYNKNTSGQYCFCKATNYTPLNGNKQSVGSSRWVVNDDLGSAAYCAENCASNCGFDVRGDAGFRAAVFRAGQ